MIYRTPLQGEPSEEVIDELFLKRQELVGSESEQPFSVGYYQSQGSLDHPLRSEVYLSNAGVGGVVGTLGVRSGIPLAGILNSETWANILIRVSRLLLEPEENPDYISVPTGAALASVIVTLGGAITTTAQVLPRPLISPDGLGGIRIEWRVHDKQLRFIARANQTPYLYHQDNNGYDVEAEPNQARMLFWFDWLLAA